MIILGPGIAEAQDTTLEEIQYLRKELQNISSRLKLLEDTYHRRQQVEETVTPQKKQGIKEIPAEKTPPKKNLEVFWQPGLHLFHFRTQDKNFTGKIGGRIYVDFGFFHEDKAIEDNLGKMSDYASFRSVRIKMAGTMYKRFFYKSHLEFVDRLSMKDVYFGIGKLPFNGKFIVGHLREPFSLEEQIARSIMTFMERAAPSALVPKRNLGLAYRGHNQAKSLTVALGFFREVSDSSPEITDDSDSYSATSRCTLAPVFAEKGQRVLHFGVGYSYRQPRNNTVRYSYGAELTEGPKLVDTGTIANVDDIHLLCGEAALVWGPFSLQSELMYSWVSPEGGNTQFDHVQQFWGYYVYASLFLTGEHRVYNRSKGVFTDIAPRRSIFDDSEFGSIELAVRYSRLDLNHDIRGRRMDSFSAGVNWYLNPNLRLMINYIYSWVDQLADNHNADAHVLASRLQIDF